MADQPGDVLGQQLMRELGREPGSWLVQHQQRRLPHEHPGHRELLTLTTTQVAGQAVPHDAQRGIQRHDLLDAGVHLPARQRVPADLQVLPDRQRLENVLHLGHVSDAKAGEAIGGQAADRPARQADAALSRLEDAEDRLGQGALPGTVRPDDRDDLAERDRHRHIGDHRDGAVPGRDPAYPQMRPGLTFLSRGGRHRPPPCWPGSGAWIPQPAPAPVP